MKPTTWPTIRSTIGACVRVIEVVLRSLMMMEPSSAVPEGVAADTAVVTANLWLKGTRSTGEAFDYKLWFSDTYVRTPTGWRYAFGQAGAPLPK